MIDAKWCVSIYPLVYVLFLRRSEALLVNITYVESAVAKGAGEILVSFSKISPQSNIEMATWLSFNINKIAAHQNFLSFSIYYLVVGFLVFEVILMFMCYFMTVCLDGSPPAYHLSPGFGTGVNNWLVHMEVSSTHDVFLFLCS